MVDFIQLYLTVKIANNVKWDVHSERCDFDRKDCR